MLSEIVVLISYHLHAEHGTRNMKHDFIFSTPISPPKNRMEKKMKDVKMTFESHVNDPQKASFIDLV